MKNKKGFTLIEVLAVVVIIGVLAGISIFAVSKFVPKTTNTAYKSLESQLESSASSYMMNTTRVDDGEKVVLYANDLKGENYLGDFVDPEDKNQECINEDNEKDSYVEVTTSEGNTKDYEYASCIKCGGKARSGICSDSGTKISFDPNNHSVSNGSISVTIKIKSLGNIKNYTYNIYKNGKKTKTDSVDTSGKEASKVVTLSGEGKYKIEVEVESQGVKYKEVSGLYQIGTGKCEKDFTIRHSGTPLGLSRTDNSIWTKNNNIKLSISNPNGKPYIITLKKVGSTSVVEQKEGYKISEEISKKLRDKTDDGTYEIDIKSIDDQRNECHVYRYIRIDTTPPTCTVSAKKSKSKTDNTEGTDAYNSGTWVNNAKVYTSPTCTDAHSGCDPSKYSVVVKRVTSGATEGTFPNITKRGVESEGETTHTWTIEDKVGNMTTCSDFSIKLDRTDPVCGTATGGSTSWSKSADIEVGVNCSDTLSGCEKSNFTTKVTDQTKTKSVEITISDNVGNTKTCTNTYNIYLDRTAPTCGTATGASTTWTKNNRTINQACADTLSGCEKSSYDATYKSTKKTDSVTISDKVGNTRSCTYNVYVDKTPPSCTVTATKSKSKTDKTKGTAGYSSGTWVNNAAVYSAPACTDPHSGCDSSKTKVVVKRVTSGATEGTFTTTERGVESQGETTHTWTLYDKVGNTRTCSTFTIKLDRENPVISHSLSGNKVTRSCSDPNGNGKSGVKSGSLTTPNPQTLSGTSQTVTSSCSDNAGNSASKSNTYTYSAHSSCGVKSYKTCTNGSCCGTSVVYGSWYHSKDIFSNSGCTFSYHQDSDVQYRTCAGGGLTVIYKVYQRSKTTVANTCTNSCCGIKEYNACWR